MSKSCDLALPAGQIWNHKPLQGELYLTCPQKHDFILSVLCQNSVHNDLGQCVVHPHTRECWSASHRVDGPIHQGVESDETDHIVWEVFSGLDPCIICFAGTLENKCFQKCLFCAKQKIISPHETE